MREPDYASFGHCDAIRCLACILKQASYLSARHVGELCKHVDLQANRGQACEQLVRRQWHILADDDTYSEQALCFGW